MTESQRRSPYRPVLVIFLIFAVVMAISQWLGPHDRMPWKSDLAAAQADARATHKPVLAYFTAEWCGPCQTMKTTVWSDRQVLRAAEAYVPVRIDIERFPELKQKYQVDSIPQIAVLDDQGNVLRSITGAREPGEMIKWLSRRSDEENASSPATPASERSEDPDPWRSAARGATLRR